MFKKLIIILVFLNIIFLAELRAGDHSVLNIRDNDFTLGQDDAPVTIIAYESLSCSHCADFHTNTLEDVKSEFIDKGIVRFVFRDFPFNYPALLGSMMMRCISSDVKYDYMNALYKLQNTWVNKDPKISKKELYKIMQSGGMTKDEFNECYSNLDNENLILEGVMAAQKDFNIKSTPSFIVNGNLIEGNKNIKEFRQIIDKILSQ